MTERLALSVRPVSGWLGKGRRTGAKWDLIMSENEARRGVFITFEGMDGSGKTTQLRLLARRLRQSGYEVVENYEPGGTSIGNQIRRILLDAANHELCPTAELLLYFASRAQNLEEIILPALNAGKIVLSDRFTDSTLVYQGEGRGLGREVVLDLDRIACRGIKPDLTLLIDVDPETSLARARERNLRLWTEGTNGETRMDDQDSTFHQRVAAAYRRLAAGEPERIAVIDGRGTVEQVAEKVWAKVADFLDKRHV